MLGAVLRRLGREDLLKPCVEEADFGLRLRFLDLLKHSTEGQALVDVPVAEMRGIAGERNILAHGHFDQNPYDGSYRLVGRGRGKAPYYAATRVHDLTIQARKAERTLRYAQAVYEFADDP